MSVQSLQKTKKAWISKKKQDEEKLSKSVTELEHLNIDEALENQELLTNWTQLNNRISSLNKEKATLESAIYCLDN